MFIVAQEQCSECAGLLVKNKLEVIWNKSIVQQFEVAFRHFIEALRKPMSKMVMMACLRAEM
jgi:hypothetical protein